MPNKRADDFYVAVQWLEDFGLIHICPRCLEPSGSLAGNIDFKRSNSFKVFPLDIGLRMAKCGYEPDFSIQDTVNNSLWGKIIEQFVHQQLYIDSKERVGVQPAYYSWQYHGKSYEIDFMIANKFDTIPVEVKSSSHFENKSLEQFKKQFFPKKIVRISPRNPGIVPPVWSLPLPATQSVIDFVNTDPCAYS
ncbi:MAG: DUF4143 domain-containing protein [Desulfovibrionaceae bacterium]|nr:DUF4143 domain-containing protein [Desulfovibrionaceae bacterium]